MSSERMTLDKWYSRSIRVPSDFKDPHYPNFVANSMGVIRSILRRKLEKRIGVSFVADLDTAAADTKNSMILIGERMLNGSFAKGVSLGAHDTICCLMGVVVHEAAHFAWSPPYLDDWADYIAKASGKPIHKQLAMQVGNLIEDIYIENKVRREIPSLFWTLEYLFDAMFKEDALLEDLDFLTKSGMEGTTRYVQAIFNTMLHLKNRELPSVNPYVDQCFELGRKAKKEVSQRQRFELAYRLYQLLAKDLEGSEEKEVADAVNKSFGAGSMSKRGDVTSQLPTRTPFGNHVNDALNTVPNAEITLGNGWSNMSLYHEIDVMEKSATVEPNPVYAELGTLARQLAAVNRPYGLAQRRGYQMRNLSRIATDQKIFAEQEQFHMPMPMDIEILMDCSGSMRWMIDGTRKVRMNEAASAVLGAAHALVNARCLVSVHGHTADLHGDQSVTIYRLKGWSEPISTLQSRLSNVVAGGVSNNNNRDGDALLYVAEQFPKRKAQRLLIVISDGLPNGRNYGGPEAVRSCAAIANHVRDELGINLLSISITREASKNNDVIYGKENNIYNEDPNVIERIVHSIISKGKAA